MLIIYLPSKGSDGHNPQKFGLTWTQKSQKGKAKKKKADFSFVVHQYDQVASLSIKRLPLNFDENAEMH